MARTGHILLAESDPNDAELLRIALSQVGVENAIDVVASEDEARAYLQRQTPFVDGEKPILVVVALRSQPVKDFSLLRWIRSQTELCDLPVFVLSGVIMKGENRRAHQLGCNWYAAKPGEFKSLVGIAQFLRDRWIAHVAEK